MNTSQIKNFAVQSRQVLMAGVLNRIIALGFDIDGNVTTDRPVKIQGGTIFMGQLREEGFYDAWMALEHRISVHSVKEVCEEAAYTWFNRLVAIRIMQKNEFIEPVMQYVSETSRIPMIVDEARSGRLSLQMSATDRDKLDELLRDSTKTNEQFNLLISAFCEANPVIYNCFGGIEKYTKLLLPDNILANGGFIDLLNTTTHLTDEDYRQSELIGWLYQFYISEKKDEVFESFKKGKKAEAEDIPAATQIFTPNWIVKYMVQNTLGRTYLDNNPYSSLGEDMKYLVKTDEPTPEEAILHLDDLQDYKMIDPACGSGHILVEAFDLLYAMYQEEAYPTRKAIEQIFTRNIIGIDLDTRAKQLATFALLMKACMRDRTFLDCKVMPRVLDMPEPFDYPGMFKEFFAHFGISGESIVNECVEAFELLKQADNLGSIMKFNLSPATRVALESRTTEWEALEFVPELIKDAMPSIKLILALTDKYTAVCANPPYMGSGSMNVGLSNYVKAKYPEGKADLFSVFMYLGMALLKDSGKMGMINMQSWMFLSSFESLRNTFLSKYVINSMLHLGPRTFDELSGEVVQNTCFVIANCSYTENASGTYYRLIDGKNCSEKENMFISKKGCFNKISQNIFERIPGSPIGYWVSNKALECLSHETFETVAHPRRTIQCGDVEKFIHLWYEVSDADTEFLHNNIDYLRTMSPKKWFKFSCGGGGRKWYGNLDSVLYWKNDGSIIKNTGKAIIPNEDLYYLECVGYNRITSNGITARLYEQGTLLGDATSILSPTNDNLYHLGLLNSVLCNHFMQIFNPTLAAQTGSLAKVPVIYERNRVNTIVSQNISISREDWNVHETSWDFKENEIIRIAKRENNTNLERALVCYISEWEAKFNQMHENEEDLNRQFIDIYGLEDELTPNVPLDEITILQAGEITHIKDESEYGGGHYVWNYDNIIKQFLSYAIGCWMGRYRLDKEGLNIAHDPTPEEICSYDINGYTFDIDDDAIIPLMGRDTPFEDDNALQKIINFVKMTFGEDNLSENLNFIEHCLGKSIEDYLVKDFWKDHKKMYQNRPIYWLFSSKKGAFQVLTYMHRMNPYTVEKIRTKYLLPYIEHLKGKIEIDEARGSDLTTVERKNLAKMKAALDECIEYHDRLHDVALKAIDFNLDDGVVVNYAKFGDVLAKIK